MLLERHFIPSTFSGISLDFYSPTLKNSNQCGKVFDIANGGGYMEYKGKAYCKEDYAALFADVCSGCKNPLIENYLSAAGGRWHEGLISNF